MEFTISRSLTCGATMAVAAAHVVLRSGAVPHLTFPGPKRVWLAEDGPQREEIAVTLPLRAVTMGIVLSFSVLSQASAQTAPGRSPVGQAVHWCLFNRPCNWGSHASIATGIVWGLSRAEVKPEVAAVVAALVFVGKEVRDERKWGNVLGSADSMGDLLAGVAGAYVGYRLFGRARSGAASPVGVRVSPEDGALVELRLSLGPGRGN